MSVTTLCNNCKQAKGTRKYIQERWLKLPRIVLLCRACAAKTDAENDTYNNEMR